MPDRRYDALRRFGWRESLQLCEWTNAWHPPMLRLAAGATACERFDGLSVLLGVPGEHRFAAAATRWRPGDRFVMFTDGILETMSRAGTPFGIAGIERILLTRPAATAPSTSTRSSTRSPRTAAPATTAPWWSSAFPEPERRHE